MVVHLLGQLARQLDRLHGRIGTSGRRRPRTGRRSSARCSGRRSRFVAPGQRSGGNVPSAASWSRGRGKRPGGRQYTHERRRYRRCRGAAPGRSPSRCGAAATARANPMPHSASACTRRDSSSRQATGSSTAAIDHRHGDAIISGARPSAVSVGQRARRAGQHPRGGAGQPAARHDRHRPPGGRLGGPPARRRGGRCDQHTAGPRPISASGMAASGASSRDVPPHRVPAQIQAAHSPAHTRAAASA